MDGIYIDFNQAKREADAIEELADRMRGRVILDFDESMEAVAGCWKGENAAAYLRKGEAMREHLLQTAEDIQAVADSVRNTARILFEAEEKAKQMAGQLSSPES